MSKKIIVTENQIIEQLQDWIIGTDADELARIAGELFGGKCFQNGTENDDPYGDNLFLFEPNDDYYGAFD